MRSVSRAKMGSRAFIALLLASLAPDIVDGMYVVARLCSPYGLYSHTVPAVVLEATVIAGIAFLATGSRVTALTFAIVVLLHVPADFFTGRKLLMPGGEMVGLYWYERPLYDYLLEVPIVLAGWALLRWSGRAPRWATSLGALALVLSVQTGFDVAGARKARGMKPNSCRQNPATPSSRVADRAAESASILSLSVAPPSRVR